MLTKLLWKELVNGFSHIYHLLIIAKEQENRKSFTIYKMENKQEIVIGTVGNKIQYEQI